MKIGDSGPWDISTAAELWESESEGEESDGEEVEALTEVSVNALRVKYGLVEAGDEEDPWEGLWRLEEELEGDTWTPGASEDKEDSDKEVFEKEDDLRIMSTPDNPDAWSEEGRM